MTQSDSSADCGPVEAAVRRMVADLGVLSPRQAIQAAQAVRLAALLDAEEHGSAASALSRELRQATAELRDVTKLPAPGPEDGPPRSRLDELAEQRARRRSEGGGGP